ncbi:MAG: prephenate dehydrogenase/arogenate dehydrogenase family protein [Chthoniobacterales bacterium]|nr:prephenate dehydrogenase/arogenate dehydrogenase family protein [Chthoniobacterales bacterium]
MLLALRERGFQGTIHLWSPNPSSLNLISSHLAALPESHPKTLISTDLLQSVHSASGIILCCPIPFMEEISAQISKHILENTWVTDVGSVKGPLVPILERILGSRYLGSHPMAGSEKKGFANARPDLFQNAVCFLTPTPHSSPITLQNVANFWQFLGCKTTLCSPEEHDQIVAHISHIPHLTAAAIVLNATAASQQFAGPGYRDSTRVALGPPELWRDILLLNKTAVLNSLNSLIQQLQLFQKALTEPNADSLLSLLSQAAEIRRKINQTTQPSTPLPYSSHSPQNPSNENT